MKTISSTQIFFTNYQKILKFLVSNPDHEHTEKDIQKAIGISRAGVNFSLRDLVRDGLVSLKKHGRMSFYSVDLDNPLIRQIKVTANLLEIKPLIETIEPFCEKIVLFGSMATGTNIKESDIDLFVLANNTQAILEKVNKSRFAEKIQVIVKKPLDYVSLRKKDPVFYDEISRGLILWEKK